MEGVGSDHPPGDGNALTPTEESEAPLVMWSRELAFSGDPGFPGALRCIASVDR